MKTTALNLVDVPCQMLVFHSWSKLVSWSRFKGLRRAGRAEYRVKYLLMGTRQVVEAHSHSLGNLTRGYKLRNCVHFKKRKLHNSATYGHAVSTRLSSECEL